MNNWPQDELRKLAEPILAPEVQLISVRIGRANRQTFLITVRQPHAQFFGDDDRLHSFQIFGDRRTNQRISEMFGLRNLVNQVIQY